jgi:hypothetical protein
MRPKVWMPAAGRDRNVRPINQINGRRQQSMDTDKLLVYELCEHYFAFDTDCTPSPSPTNISNQSD